MRRDDGFKRARELLQEEGFRPLFMAVKGSTLYDLPGTHKDLDVRAVYLARTEETLSIRKPQHTFERTEGELDFVGWEAERFFHHLLKHNGNMVEMLLAPEEFVWFSSDGWSLRQIGPRFLTRHLHRYYRGFAANQFKRAKSQINTGKGILYTYREMYAGLWLMRTGSLVFPWDELRRKVEDEAGLYRSEVLPGILMDRRVVSSSTLDAMAREFEALTEMLDKSVADSPLPEDYDGYDVCNRLLLGWRSSGWLSSPIEREEAE